MKYSEKIKENICLLDKYAQISQVFVIKVYIVRKVYVSTLKIW